jgi:hypothetical protein
LIPSSSSPSSSTTTDTLLVGPHLDYYEVVNQQLRLRGTIPLSSIWDVKVFHENPSTGGGREGGEVFFFSFVLLSDTRVYTLHASDANERTSWIEVIKRFLKPRFLLSGWLNKVTSKQLISPLSPPLSPGSSFLTSRSSPNLLLLSASLETL